MLARDGKRPEYITDGSGPDHERTFVASVQVDGISLGSRVGSVQEEAEQGAAEKALDSLIADSR